jgi:hypothetical protein
LGQAKLAFGGSILGLRQFTLLSQLPLKKMLNLNLVKINSKIIILLHQSKSMTHSVDAINNFLKKSEIIIEAQTWKNVVVEIAVRRRCQGL